MKPTRSILFLLIILSVVLSPVSNLAEIFMAGEVMREATEAFGARDYHRVITLADSIIENSKRDFVKIEALNLKAKGHMAMGELGKADDDFHNALDFFDQCDDLDNMVDKKGDPDYNALLFNYTQFMIKCGRYGEALAMLDSIQFPRGSQPWIKAKGAAASAMMRLGNFDGARALLDILLNSFVATKDNQQTTAILLQNRGFVNLNLKDYQSAKRDLGNALDLLEGKSKEITRANYAVALARSGCLSEAEKEIYSAVEALGKTYGPEDPDYIIALRKRGEIATLAGKPTQAARIMRNFHHLEKKRLCSILPTLSPLERLSYWTMEKSSLSQCFLVSETDPTLALDVALLRRETSLLGIAEGQEAQRRLNFDSRMLCDVLGDDRAAVALILYNDIEENLQYAALVVAPSSKPKFIPLFDNNFIYTPRYNGISIYDALTSEDPELKRLLYTDTLLGETVWRPILTALPASIKNVNFAPEGVFHLWGIENMPFAGCDGYRLERRFSLVDLKPPKTEDDKTLGVSILLAGGLDYDAESAPGEGQSQRGGNEAFKSLCDVTGHSPSNKIFQYLPGTANEIKELSVLRPDATVTETLTEEDFKKTAGDYPVLHLATHGYSLDCGVAAPVFPTDSIGFDLSLLRSGLALTGANVNGTLAGREDGILSAREICDLDLDGVEMAVLSACQTAQGLITDESASGLVRALKRAGVKTIVASLWEVDDRSAIIFMKSFYTALNNGLQPADAMKAARESVSNSSATLYRRKFNPATLASRKSKDTIETRPYESPWFWAPFIIIDP